MPSTPPPQHDPTATWRAQWRTTTEAWHTRAPTPDERACAVGMLLIEPHWDNDQDTEYLRAGMDQWCTDAIIQLWDGWVHSSVDKSTKEALATHLVRALVPQAWATRSDTGFAQSWPEITTLLSFGCASVTLAHAGHINALEDLWAHNPVHLQTVLSAQKDMSPSEIWFATIALLPKTAPSTTWDILWSGLMGYAPKTSSAIPLSVSALQVSMRFAPTPWIIERMRDQKRVNTHAAWTLWGNDAIKKQCWDVLAFVAENTTPKMVEDNLLDQALRAKSNTALDILWPHLPPQLSHTTLMEHANTPLETFKRLWSKHNPDKTVPVLSALISRHASVLGGAINDPDTAAKMLWAVEHMSPLGLICTLEDLNNPCTPHTLRAIDPIVDRLNDGAMALIIGGNASVAQCASWQARVSKQELESELGQRGTVRAPRVM